MAYIDFELTTNGLLNTLAASGAGSTFKAMLPAGLAGAGLYMIYNKNSNNRYFGKAINLAKRFNTRMQVVTEMGLRQQDLLDIGAHWGPVKAYETKHLSGSSPYQLPSFLGRTNNKEYEDFEMNDAAVKTLKRIRTHSTLVTIPYRDDCIEVMLDGARVNVEHLLIRVFMQAIGCGGTITNGTYANTVFYNRSRKELIVRVQFGALCGEAASDTVIVLPASGGYV